MKLNFHALESISSSDKHILDILSLNVVWLSFFEKLPEIALLVTIAWTLIRIYETDTVQKLLGRKKDE